MTVPSVRCPEGHTNPIGQNYCGQCGASLAGLCPNGHINPSGQLFCGSCGTRLTGLLHASPPPASAPVTEESCVGKEATSSSRVGVDFSRSTAEDLKPDSNAGDVSGFGTSSQCQPRQRVTAPPSDDAGRGGTRLDRILYGEIGKSRKSVIWLVFGALVIILIFATVKGCGTNSAPERSYLEMIKNNSPPSWVWPDDDTLIEQGHNICTDIRDAVGLQEDYAEAFYYGSHHQPDLSMDQIGKPELQIKAALNNLCPGVHAH